MARSKFWSWLFSSCIDTTMLVGRCVSRTAESVVLTLWPPGPLDRYTSRLTSFGSIETSTSSTSGSTATVAARGVQAALALGGRHPLHPVDAGLVLEDGVGAGALHGERHLAQPAGVGLGGSTAARPSARATPRSACRRPGGRARRAPPPRRRRPPGSRRSCCGRRRGRARSWPRGCSRRGTRAPPAPPPAARDTSGSSSSASIASASRTRPSASSKRSARSNASASCDQRRVTSA